jgi:acetyl-CoA carboxylase carboxyltransferase component
VPAVAPTRDAEQLLTLVPADPRRGYDMRKVLEAIFDGESVTPWKEKFGASLYTAFARLEGESVGVLASQPMQRAGVLDVPALAKLAHFADICDTFNIPLVFLQDVPGLMVGSHAEKGGILAGYEKVVARLASAHVPKIAVVVRKAYGGGHFALGGRPTHPDLILAWPTAELGFMAPDTGIRTVYKRRLEEVLAREGEEAHAALVDELRADWQHESEPWEAAAHLFIDDVIDPRTTRAALVAAIDFAWGNRPKVAQRPFTH